MSLLDFVSASYSEAIIVRLCLNQGFLDNSDIDLLVQFKPDHIPGLLEIVGMEQELSQMFGGRKIDLRTAEDLSRYFRAEIIDRAVSQYEVS